MAKARIYELAKKRGLNPARLLEGLKACGYDVKATLSTVDEDAVDAKGNIVKLIPQQGKKQSKETKKAKPQPKAEEVKVEPPKEPETLKVTAQAQKAGQKAVFRVSKPLTKIKQEELLPPAPPPKPPEKKKPEITEKPPSTAKTKKEEAEEIIGKTSEAAAKETKPKQGAPEAEEKAAPDRAAEHGTQQPVPSLLKRAEEGRKVVLPKAPVREPSQYIQRHPHQEGQGADAGRAPTAPRVPHLPRIVSRADSHSQAPAKERGGGLVPDRSQMAQQPKPVTVPDRQAAKPAEGRPAPVSFPRPPETKKKSKRDRRLDKLQAKQNRFEKIEQEILEDQAQAAEHGEAIFIREGVTVKELAEKTNVKVKDIIQKFIMRGTFLTINQPLAPELAIQVCSSFGYQAEIISFEDELVMAQESPREGEKVGRAPIVTVMGHVDHGKSSLLEAIHNIDITGHEHGGITQHIGAYKVRRKDKEYVFLDTPGHEAFTMMRARGG